MTGEARGWAGDRVPADDTSCVTARFERPPLRQPGQVGLALAPLGAVRSPDVRPVAGRARMVDDEGPGA